jgi:hypothetical protein
MIDKRVAVPAARAEVPTHLFPRPDGWCMLCTYTPVPSRSFALVPAFWYERTGRLGPKFPER